MYASKNTILQEARTAIQARLKKLEEIDLAYMNSYSSYTKRIGWQKATIVLLSLLLTSMLLLWNIIINSIIPSNSYYDGMRVLSYVAYFSVCLFIFVLIRCKIARLKCISVIDKKLTETNLIKEKVNGMLYSLDQSYADLMSSINEKEKTFDTNFVIDNEIKELENKAKSFAVPDSNFWEKIIFFVFYISSIASNLFIMKYIEGSLHVFISGIFSNPALESIFEFFLPLICIGVYIFFFINNIKNDRQESFILFVVSLMCIPVSIGILLVISAILAVIWIVLYTIAMIAIAVLKVLFYIVVFIIIIGFFGAAAGGG